MCVVCVCPCAHAISIRELESVRGSIAVKMSTCTECSAENLGHAANTRILNSHLYFNYYHYSLHFFCLHIRPAAVCQMRAFVWSPHQFAGNAFRIISTNSMEILSVCAWAMARLFSLSFFGCDAERALKHIIALNRKSWIAWNSLVW